MSEKTKVSVVLTSDEFARFDAFCKAKGYKKSTLIARLVREQMDREDFAVQRSLPLAEPRAIPVSAHPNKRRA